MSLDGSTLPSGPEALLQDSNSSCCDGPRGPGARLSTTALAVGIYTVLHRWRCLEDGRSHVEKKVVPCFDVTPLFDEEDDVRGYEIQAWLELHPEVDRYAILDDETDFLEHQ